MSSSYPPPPYYYIAFIDEAGDPGISRVKPIDPTGGSEWLVIGGVVIEARRELEPVQWVRSLLTNVGLGQRRELHFRDLAEWRKPLVCQEAATRPLRIFAMLSNKKNMRGHTNPRAEAKANPLTSKQYFYNYCVRLILERITDYCYRHSMRFYGEPRRVKIIFSQRGGHSYGHTIAYSEILKIQSRAESTFLNKRTINWQMVDLKLFEVLEHKANAGLQLADVVASSFYQAVDVLPPANWNPSYAKLLKPRIATEHSFYRDYGVAFQPTPPHRANLLKDQKEIFEFYGYDGRDF
jgi:Protein of unknown function (DUF3800)